MAQERGLAILLVNDTGTVVSSMDLLDGIDIETLVAVKPATSRIVEEAAAAGVGFYHAIVFDLPNMPAILAVQFAQRIRAMVPCATMVILASCPSMQEERLVTVRRDPESMQVLLNHTASRRGSWLCGC